MSDIQIQTVTGDRFSMDFFRFGKGKDTLVILPGVSVQSVMPAKLAIAQAYQLLTDAYTLYVFDRTREMPQGYSIGDMAEDTAQALARLGLHSVSVFGASQGGMIALELALRHPEMVDKLVLGSSAARVTPEQYQQFEGWISLARDGKAGELYMAFGRAIYPQAVFERSKALLLKAAETVTGEDLKRFIIMVQAMNGFDVTRSLCRITCPVLVLGAEDDQVLGAQASPEIAQRLSASPRHELFVYNGFGHAAFDTAPDYRERMLKFLRQ